VTRARDRWLIFSNGLEQSRFWPWGTDLTVELETFDWPSEWDRAGIAREIRYDSDKMLPDKHDDSVVPYLHDFRRLPPYVDVFVPRGMGEQSAEPVERASLTRRSFEEGRPRFPTQLAFLAKCTGWSMCPPGRGRACRLDHAVEAHLQNCVLMASPEGDMLVVLDGDDRYKCAAVMLGPTLVVERDGIDD
jgi:hypothetical protein